MANKINAMEIEEEAHTPRTVTLKRSTVLLGGAGVTFTLIAVFLVTFLVTYYNAPGKASDNIIVVTNPITTTKQPDTTPTTPTTQAPVTTPTSSPSTGSSSSTSPTTPGTVPLGSSSSSASPASSGSSASPVTGSTGSSSTGSGSPASPTSPTSPGTGSVDSTPSSPASPTSTETTTTRTPITTTVLRPEDFRLPRDLLPTLYDIKIQPYFKASTEPTYYDGYVEIMLNCVSDTNKLVITTKDINMTHSGISSETDNDFKPEINFGWTYDADKQFSTAVFANTESGKSYFKANNVYKLFIDFKVTVRNDNVAFYKSSYTGADGDKRWLLTSQMEPVEARKAFPCFDEPDMKAIFRITVVHDSSLHVYSNMPEISSIPGQTIDGYNWVETKFRDTLVMSSYLVALVVSDFVCKSGKATMPLSGSVDVSTCARPTAENELDYPLEAAVDIIAFFEGYYNTEYPFPKCDHVAVRDFRFGAMENWGLAIYVERNLLKNENTTKAGELAIVRVIAHEISHMWFGNLVTPKWWSDLWLNEGFARYMENVGTNSVRPNWNMFDQHAHLVFTVLHSDAKESTKAVVAELLRPTDIDTATDSTITYGKGSAVVRMNNYLLGDTVFNLALGDYFEKHKFQNVDQNDLWNALYARGKLEGKLGDITDLAEVMSTWTRQKGHPLVTIRRKNGTQISLTQKRFILDSARQSNILVDNLKWYIPFTYAVETLGSANQETLGANRNNLHDKIIWFKPEEDEKIITIRGSLDQKDNFILANLDAFGFYHIDYDDQDWDLIIKQLKDNREAVPARIRAQLIHDTFALSQAALRDPTVPLELLEFIKTENNYLPLLAFTTRIRYYIDMLESTDLYGQFEGYVQNLISPIYERFGWEEKPDEEWIDYTIRTEVLRLACQYGLSKCVQTAKNYLAELKTNPAQNKIPLSYRSNVYCTAVKFGDRADWEFLFNLYNKSETDATEKSNILAGLSCAKESWLLQRYLNFVIDLKTDVIVNIRAAAAKQYGGLITWNFVKENWVKLYNRFANEPYTSYTPPLGNLLYDIASKLNTRNQFVDFITFFSMNPKERVGNEVEIASETINANADWIRRSQSKIATWLNNYKPSGEIDVNYRLPTNLRPTAYDLRIKPYIGTEETYGNKSFTFEGRVIMNLVCDVPTNQIIFHAVGLSIDPNQLTLTSPTDQDMIELTKGIQTDKVRDFVILTLNKNCVAGSEYSLTVVYTANILSTTYGFYRSSYTEADGKIYYLASTHFQPTDARKAFPCLDEPAMKAKFTLSIIRDKAFTVSLANSPLANTIPYTDPNWEIDVFEETVPMSTYLLAFSVSSFEKIQKTSSDGVLIEVVARPEAIRNGEGQHALDDGALIIDFFSSYFDTAYPLNKSTQLAVPEFNAGAMENWGLIIYRESAMLYNPKSDTLANKRRVTTVVSHELAHQWFGNLVTPKWWSDTWLNEGFASYVEFLGIDLCHPQWRELDFFFVRHLRSFLLDSLESSHPISQEVTNPNQVNSMFDAIAYEKGASIIRMMSVFLKDDTFKKGVSNYLKKYRMSNAEQDDLWEELTKQALADGTLDDSITVKDIMDTWTLKMGYPVVDVKRNAAEKKLVLNQRWFLLNPLNKMQKPENLAEYNTKKWYVPFTFTTQEAADFEPESTIHWIRPNDKDLELALPANFDKDSWVLGNLGHSGFYRVNYDSETWDLIIKQLLNGYTTIKNIDRAQLVDDSYYLGRAEAIDQLVFLRLINYLSEETDYMAFVPAFAGLDYIANMLSNQPEALSRFYNYGQKLLTNTYNRLGWKTLDDINDIDLQLATITRICTYGNKACVNQARSYYDDWRNFGTPLPNDFKTVIYETVIKFGTDQDWHDLYDIMMKTQTPAEKLRMLRGLTATTNYKLLQTILSKTADPNVVKGQDETSMIANVAANPVGRIMVVDYLDEKWDYIVGKYGGVSFTLPTLISNVFNKLNTQFELKKVEDFIRRHPNLEVAENAFNQAIENINTNIRWMDKYFAKVDAYLEENGKTEEINYRLPEDIKPSLYELQIRPYIGTNETYGDRAFTFDGEMVMHFKCVNPTDKVVFHSEKHKIHEDKLTLTSTEDPNPIGIEGKLKYDEEREYNILSLNRNCVKDANYALKIVYEGEILSSLYGFYRSSYKDDTGKVHYLAVTDFEPIDARFAFPCFDEPAMKAKLKMTIIRHKDHPTTFSNGALLNSVPHTDPDWVIDTFAETVPMSTYLMAYAVTDFDTISKKSGKGFDVQVSARPNAIAAGEGDFGLNEATTIIDFFGQYFGVDYALNKSTQIAIPDFNSGAMENWGLITYRETSLLFNPTSDTVSNQRRVSLVISHELAHQWFGNLVSPKWWNDLWLNEGFASWVEYLGLDASHPEWRDLDYFLYHKIPTMASDSLESSHPISATINNPKDIVTIFDTISYNKGASIVRMINAFITEDSFKAGVSKYLVRFRFDNAEQDDLWEELTKQAHADGTLDSSLTIKQIMDTWTLQMGYPVVDVKRDFTNKQLVLNQKWFLLNPLNKMEQPQNLQTYNSYQWYVPFTFTTLKEANFDFESKVSWLKPKEVDVVIPAADLDATTWVLANIKRSGFYRVNYDIDNWNLLIAQLKVDLGKIDVTSRAQIIDDTFNLGMAEKLDLSVYLQIIDYLQQEQDSLPLLSSLSGFDFIYQMFADNLNTFNAFKNYFIKLFEPTYNRLGWNEAVPDVNDIELQTGILSRMCSFGYKACVDKARELYFEWINNDKPLPNNFKSLIYDVIAKYGSEAEWIALYERALNTPNAAEKYRILSRLTNTRDTTLLKFILSKASDESVIRRQDETAFITAVASNPFGRKMAFDYVVENWSELIDRYGSVSFTLPNLITRGFNRMNSRADLDRVENFLQKQGDVGIASLAFQQTVENIKLNIRWMTQNAAKVQKWFEDNAM